MDEKIIIFSFTVSLCDSRPCRHSGDLHSGYRQSSPIRLNPDQLWLCLLGCRLSVRACAKWHRARRSAGTTPWDTAHLKCRNLLHLAAISLVAAARLSTGDCASSGNRRIGKHTSGFFGIFFYIFV